MRYLVSQEQKINFTRELNGAISKWPWEQRAFREEYSGSKNDNGCQIFTSTVTNLINILKDIIAKLLFLLFASC
jgi:hypothetical protein